MNTSKGHRLVQFELLRILAMLYVVLNHVIGYGLGIFESFTVNTSTTSGFILWSVLQIMKLIPLVGVNLFVLITDRKTTTACQGDMAYMEHRMVLCRRHLPFGIHYRCGSIHMA